MAAKHAFRQYAPPVILMVVILIAVGELAASVWQQNTHASVKDWNAVSAHLKTNRKPDSAVVWSPYWLSPLVRQHVDNLTNDDVSINDIDRFGTVHEIALGDSQHPWLNQSWDTTIETFGPLVLRTYTRQPTKIAYDFTEQFSNAAVKRVSAADHTKTTTKCVRKNDNEVDCGKSWNWVGPTIAEVDFKPKRALNAHPQKKSVLHVTYNDVPTQATKLTVYAGISRRYHRVRKKGAVRLKVWAGEQLIADFNVDSDSNWSAKTFDVKPSETVYRFEVSSENPHLRTYAFHAELRE